MLDRGSLIAAQKQGRTLLRNGEYRAAAVVFEAALALPRLPGPTTLPNIDDLREDLTTTLGHEMSSVPVPRQCPLQWFPEEGSDETVVLSTRLLLAIALHRGDAPRQGLVIMQELVAEPSTLIPGSGLHSKALLQLAELCLLLGQPDDLAIGLATCRQLLQSTCGAWDVGQVYDLEAALQIANCKCDANAQCLCGSLEQARVATTAAIGACSEAAAIADIGQKRNRALGMRGKAQRQGQEKRELSLRQLQIRLGLVDLHAESEAAAAAVERKLRNQRHRIRRQDRAAACLNDLLSELAPDIEQKRHVLANLCNPDISLEERMDWGLVPAALQPNSSDAGGLAHDSHRMDRKRWQLESIFVALAHVLGHRYPCQTIVLDSAGGDVKHSVNGYDHKAFHIVDFGSGSGNSVLAIAALLPDFHVTLVEASETDVNISRRRVVDAGLRNVSVWHGDLELFPEAFDVGLATHLCGEGTDLAQAKCIAQGAAFVMIPCCLGGIKHLLQGHSRNQGVSPNIRSGLPEGGAQLQYPRSSWLRQRLKVSEYLQLVRLCDCNGSDAAGGAAAASKQLLDADRLALAAEAGYETYCGKLWPEEASKKNDVLIGWPRNNHTIPVGDGIVA